MVEHDVAGVVHSIWESSPKFDNLLMSAEDFFANRVAGDQEKEARGTETVADRGIKRELEGPASTESSRDQKKARGTGSTSARSRSTIRSASITTEDRNTYLTKYEKLREDAGIWMLEVVDVRARTQHLDARRWRNGIQFVLRFSPWFQRNFQKNLLTGQASQQGVDQELHGEEQFEEDKNHLVLHVHYRVKYAFSPPSTLEGENPDVKYTNVPVEYGEKLLVRHFTDMAGIFGGIPNEASTDIYLAPRGQCSPFRVNVGATYRVLRDSLDKRETYADVPYGRSSLGRPELGLLQMQENRVGTRYSYGHTPRFAITPTTYKYEHKNWGIRAVSKVLDVCAVKFFPRSNEPISTTRLFSVYFEAWYHSFYDFRRDVCCTSSVAEITALMKKEQSRLNEVSQRLPPVAPFRIDVGGRVFGMEKVVGQGMDGMILTINELPRRPWEKSKDGEQARPITFAMKVWAPDAGGTANLQVICEASGLWQHQGDAPKLWWGQFRGSMGSTPVPGVRPYKKMGSLSRSEPQDLFRDDFSEQEEKALRSYMQNLGVLCMDQSPTSWPLQLPGAPRYVGSNILIMEYLQNSATLGAWHGFVDDLLEFVHNTSDNENESDVLRLRTFVGNVYQCHSAIARLVTRSIVGCRSYDLVSDNIMLENLEGVKEAAKILTTRPAEKRRRLEEASANVTTIVAKLEELVSVCTSSTGITTIKVKLIDFAKSDGMGNFGLARQKQEGIERFMKQRSERLGAVRQQWGDFGRP